MYLVLQKKDAGIKKISWKYLAAVCRESDGDIRDTYREIKDLMKKESKQFDSDIYSLSIVNVIDPNEEHKYLKYIFAKVKQI